MVTYSIYGYIPQWRQQFHGVSCVLHGFHERLSELSLYFVLAFCGRGTSCFGQAPVLASYKSKWIKNILGH